MDIYIYMCVYIYKCLYKCLLCLTVKKEYSNTGLECIL